MMRKIIGKIIDIVLPPKEKVQASEEAPTAPIKEVKAVSLEQILGGALGRHQPSQTYELSVCILRLKTKRLLN